MMMSLEELLWPLVRTYRKVVKIVQWLPLLWRDEDFSYGYLLDIIQYKLRRMADHIEANDRHVGCRPTVKSMRITAQHIDSYKNPSGYSVVKDLKLNWQPLENGNYRLLPATYTYENFPFAAHSRKNITAMEKWHWEQIWERLKKDGQSYWD